MATKTTYQFQPPPPLAGLEDIDAGDSLLDHEPDAGDDPIEALRDLLDLPDEISDVTIAASLASIAAKGDNRARWLAAFSSPLGKWLALRGSDLNTALNTVLAVTPKAPS